MSLYYHNLPDVKNPEAVAHHSRLSLAEIEEYLRNARDHQLKLTPLFKWELCGYFYELVSKDLSNTEITNLLSKKPKIREIRKSGEDELISTHVYYEQRLIELNQYIDSSSQLEIIDGDNIYALEPKEVELGRIGKGIILPHYRIGLLPFNESEEESHQMIEKFFNDDHKHVQVIESTWVNANGITRKMQKKPHDLWKKKYQIKVLRKEWKNQAIQLKKLPASGIIAVRPNTYQINKQLSAIKKLRLSPLSEHRPLIRLFEVSNFVTWPYVRDSGGEN